jgi:hypothetical protein
LTERVLVYALGGGSGHALRGALLGAALQREGAATTVWVAHESLEHTRGLHSDLVACPRPESPEALRRALEALVRERGITLLIVDTFAEGLLGERPGQLAGVRRVALLRARKDGRLPAFLRELDPYERCLDLEPDLGWLPEGVAAETKPVVRALDREPSDVDVLLAAGEEGRLSSFLGRLGERLERAGLRVERRARGDGLLAARDLSARVVVGAAGYNLSYELGRLGTWHLAIPLPRRLDVQAARAQRLAVVCADPMELEREAIRLVVHGDQRRVVPTQTHRELARTILGR